MNHALPAQVFLRFGVCSKLRAFLRRGCQECASEEELSQALRLLQVNHPPVPAYHMARCLPDSSTASHTQAQNRHDHLSALLLFTPLICGNMAG